MDINEAHEWLAGKRSLVNFIPQHPIETLQERIASADCAMTQMAYWIVKANRESVVVCGQSPDNHAYDIEKWLQEFMAKSLALK
jgi:hypothetical protein